MPAPFDFEPIEESIRISNKLDRLYIESKKKEIALKRWKFVYLMLAALTAAFLALGGAFNAVASLQSQKDSDSYRYTAITFFMVSALCGPCIPIANALKEACHGRHSRLIVGVQEAGKDMCQFDPGFDLKLYLAEKDDLDKAKK